MNLGATLLDRLKLFCYVFWIPARKRLGIKKEVAYAVTISKLGKQFTFFITDTSDLAILYEIFVGDEYEHTPILTSTKVILDMGSNVGLSVIYFSLLYPEAKIYGFEPDPKTFEKLQRNTKAFPNIFVYNIAISDTDGTATFFSHINSMSSSLVERKGETISFQVTTRSLDSWLSEQKISHVDLLKFDVEGGEYMIFSHCQSLSNIDRLVGELHLDLISVSHEEFNQLFPFHTCVSKPLSRYRFVVDYTKK